MTSMFRYVHFAGCSPLWMAAFFLAHGFLAGPIE